MLGGANERNLEQRPGAHLPLAYPPRWLVPLALLPLVLALVVIMGPTLYLLLFHRTHAFNPSTQLPVPANARAVVKREPPGFMAGSFVEYYQQLEFVTSDTPSAVFTFYKTELEKQDWHFGGVQSTANGSRLGFDNPDGCPFWQLSVGAEQQPDQTAIKIEMYMEYCR